MRSTWGLGLLLFAFASSAFAQADLQITSSASPSSGLVTDQEFLVTTVIRNNGPNAATNVSGSIFLPQGEEFWFDFAGSVSGCAIEQFEIDPPAFLLIWSYAALAVGEERTCVARLSVRNPPPSNATVLFAHVDSTPVDPVGANDDATMPISFGAFVSTARHTIPSTSNWGLALLALGALALGFYAWKRGNA